MKKVTVFIDDNKIEVDENMTIVQAAKQAGIDVPTLCHMEDLKTKGNCRVCVVEVDNSPKLATACSTPVREGMTVKTKSEKVLEARKSIVELILCDHNRNCPFCEKNKDCELQKIADDLEIIEESFEEVYKPKPQEICNGLMVKEMDKCVKCGRCIEACNEIQTVGVLGMVNRSHESEVRALEGNINDSNCIKCGKCIEVCPVAAVYENKHIFPFWGMIDDESKHVVAYIMPDEEFELGKTYGYDQAKDLSVEKVAGFLEKIGVDKVLDASIAVDIAESRRYEELEERKASWQALPLIVSDDPSFLRFVETFYPHYKENLSNVKPSLQLMGGLIKDHYSEKLGVDRSDVVAVAVTSQLSYKVEVDKDANERDVDLVLTPGEIALVMKQTMYNIADLDELELENKELVHYLDDYMEGAEGSNIFKKLQINTYVEAREILEKITDTNVDVLVFDEKRDSKISELSILRRDDEKRII